ncbi:hypothetical protein [Bacillus mycoides]|uniref:hypothetical protein n=1 Tax=Bacillus mycoides TaxID=1405 RepID=UPI003A7FEB62
MLVQRNGDDVMLGQPLIVVGDINGEDVFKEVLRGAGDKYKDYVGNIEFENHSPAFDDYFDDAYKSKSTEALVELVQQGKSVAVLSDYKGYRVELLNTLIRARVKGQLDKGLIVIGDADREVIWKVKDVLKEKGLQLGKDISMLLTFDAETADKGLQDLHGECKDAMYYELMDALDVVTLDVEDDDTEPGIWLVEKDFNEYGLREYIK